MNAPIELHLGVRVRPENQPAFETFLREAIPVYEQNGGMRVRVIKSLADPCHMLEIIEYADRATFDADQVRVQTDPVLRALLQRWHALLDGPPTVVSWIDSTAACAPWPPELPLLRTRRLLLRAFQEADVDRVVELCADAEIARNTLFTPHPYTRDAALAWLHSHHRAMRASRGPTYAITVDDELVGAIGLGVDAAHNRAELGYWIGKKHWNRGIASEAAAAMLEHGFSTLNLGRIFAGHYLANPASGKVLRRIGMLHEGTFRRHVLRFGVWHDVEMYALLKTDWLAPRPAESAS